MGLADGWGSEKVRAWGPVDSGWSRVVEASDRGDGNSL